MQTPWPMVEFLQIEPTTRCNFKCGFCCGRAMTQSDISVEVFERALADHPGVRHIQLQGEGEPLIHPGFFDMLEKARAKNVAVSFITNGSYFTPRTISRLLSGSVERINVSLESADSETFRAIRGGKLEKVIKGTGKLMAERSRLGLATPVVGFSVTVLKRTIDHLSGILDLYCRLGLDGGISIQPLQKMSAYTATYDATMAAEHLSQSEVDHLLITARTDRRIRRIEKHGNPGAGFDEHLMKGWRPASRSCPWIEKGIYVNRDGIASTCCMIKDEKYALGKIGVDSEQKMRAARIAMRDQLKNGQIPQACEGCEIARFAVMPKLRLVRYTIKAAVNSIKSATRL
jgi:MoaA/NifB/PqqE/SkfB family radical SAM enzyme